VTGDCCGNDRLGQLAASIVIPWAGTNKGGNTMLLSVPSIEMQPKWLKWLAGQISELGSLISLNTSCVIN